MDDAGPRVANCFVDFLHLCASFGTAATVVVESFTGTNVGSNIAEDVVLEDIVEDVVEESMIAKSDVFLVGFCTFGEV